MTENQNWEYRVLTIGGALSGPKDEILEAQLNEWGEEGWEVFAVTPIEGSNKVRITARRLLAGAVRRQRRWPDPD